MNKGRKPEYREETNGDKHPKIKRPSGLVGRCPTEEWRERGLSPAFPSRAILVQLGRVEVLWGLRNFLNIDRPKHHITDYLKERGMEKGSGRHSNLRGRERPVLIQANIDTVSRATLGRLLRDKAERVWVFPSTTMSSGDETKAETGGLQLWST